MAWKISPPTKSGGAWTLTPPAAPQTSAEDLGRSAVQGVTHDAPAGILGTPGAMLDVGHWLGRMLTGESKEQSDAREAGIKQTYAKHGLPDIAGAIRPPDPETISGAIDKVIPSYHSPTEAGQFVETATSLLPAAISPTGASTIAGNVLRRGARVLVPATTSELAGNSVKGTDLEPLARTLGALGGGAAVEAGGGIAGRFGATHDQRALRFIKQALDDAKITPAQFQTAANKIQAAGGSVEEMLFELLGEPGRRLARAVYNVRGPSSQIGADALGDRKAGVTNRVTQAASRATGVGGKNGTDQIGDFLENLENARKTGSRPLYEKAYEAVIPDDVFRRDLKPIMAGDGAAAKARTFAIQHAEADITRHQAELSAATRAGNQAAATRIEAELADARLARDNLRAFEGDKATGPDSINVRALDYFQRGMRSIAEDQGVHTGLGSANLAGQHEFNALLDAEVPEFAAARQFYAGNKAQAEMVEEGRKVFETDDFAITKLAKSMSPSEREAWMVGVMRAISDKLFRGDTAFVARLTRDKNLREQLTKAFGDTRKANQFFSRVTREANMAQSDNLIRSGSRTTPLAEDIRSLTEGEDELGFISEMAKHGGNVKPIAWKWLSDIYDRTRRPGIYNPGVNEALGTRLFGKANGPRTRDLLQDLQANPLNNLNGQLGLPTWPIYATSGRRTPAAQNASDEELLKAIEATN